MSFLNQYLDDAKPDNIQNVVREQAVSVRALERRNVSASQLSNLANEFGELAFRAVDDMGRLRMIMSAISLLEEFGIKAYFAGLNVNGKPTFWVDADDGALTAAAGNTKVNAHGILSSAWGPMIGIDDGDTLIFGGMNLSGFGLASGVHYLGPYTLDLFADNGDFEYGDFTNYTQTGSPEIIADSVDGNYCARVDWNNYISRSFSATVDRYYCVTLFSRYGDDWLGSYPKLEIAGADATYFYLNISDAWAKRIIVFKATSTTVTLTFRGSLADTTVGYYYDNIKVQKLQNFSTISTEGFGNSGAIFLKSWSDGLGLTTRIRLDAPLIQFEEALTLIEKSSVTTPAAGYGRIYFKTDNLPYAKNDAGTEMLLSVLDANGLIIQAIQRIVAGTGALTATEGYTGWQSTTKRLRIYDTQRERSISSVGWVPFAFPISFSPDAAFTTALNLAANGGSIAIPIMVTGHMLLESVSVRNTDTTLERTWAWDLYEQYLNNGNGAENTLTRVANSNGSQTFTAAAAGTRALSCFPPIYLAPGLYWLVVQNRHATNTFGVGSTAASAAFAVNTAQTKATTNPNGATLDFVAATWTKVTDMYAVRLNGRVFGQAAAF